MSKIKTIFINDDALRVLKKLPSESVDLSIIDPPYPSLEKHRAVGTTTRLQDWIPISTFEYIGLVMDELYRILKKNSHLYIFVNGDALFRIRNMAKQAGFKYWKFLTWNKMAIGMGYHYRNQCEYILFLEKGKRRVNSLSISDYLEEKRIKSKTAYPTEKPMGIIRTLIEQSSNPGEIVLDAFVGSGTTCFAARACGRHSIGIDIASLAGEHQRSRANSCCIPLKNGELRADFAAAYRLLTLASEET